MTINLVQHRSDASVWDQTGRPHMDVERWGTAGLAAVLLVGGLRRRTWPGLLLALGAGALAWWAAAEPEQRRAGRDLLRGRRHRAQDARVMEASQESFPASDAPSWSPTTGHIGPSPAPSSSVL